VSRHRGRLLSAGSLTRRNEATRTASQPASPSPPLHTNNIRSTQPPTPSGMGKRSHTYSFSTGITFAATTHQQQHQVNSASYPSGTGKRSHTYSFSTGITFAATTHQQQHQVNSASYPQRDGKWVVAYGLRGEGLVWLIGAVVCLLAATVGPPVCWRGQWMSA